MKINRIRLANGIRCEENKENVMCCEYACMCNYHIDTFHTVQAHIELFQTKSRQRTKITATTTITVASNASKNENIFVI